MNKLQHLQYLNLNRPSRYADNITAIQVKPSLHLNFARNKSLMDNVTGNNIITFTRASNATFFGSNGLLQTASTNVPRFDHNPTTGASLGLLVEEARTNLCLQSENFATTWTANLSTITVNTTTSPDGETNADGLLANSAGGSVLQTSQSFTAGSTITYSVFAKKNSSNFLQVEIGSLVNCWWNLNTGTTASNSAGTGNVLFSSKSIQSVGNGWYRCIITVTTSVITTISLNNYPTNSDGNSSSINSSIFLWGAQLEVGTFATSYIPTTTASATRNGCLVKINTLSPWYSATVGTLFAEGSRYAAGLTTGIITGFAQNLTFTQSMYISNNVTAGNVLTVNVYNGGLQASLGGTVASGVTNNLKVALAYEANNFARSFNGEAVATATSGTIPTVQNLTIGSSPWTNSPDNNWSGWIRQIVYFPQRLSNTNLQRITQ